MTFKEKLWIDIPKMKNSKTGYKMCPSYYGYEKPRTSPCCIPYNKYFLANCDACWDREMDEAEEKPVERLIWGEAHGYTRALMDLKKILTGVAEDAKDHKVKLTGKQMDSIMRLVIKNRAIIRDNPASTIRYNESHKKWEIFFDVRYDEERCRRSNGNSLYIVGGRH